MTYLKNSLSIISALVIVGSAFFFGVNVGKVEYQYGSPENLCNTETLSYIPGIRGASSTAAAVDFAPFWKSWRLLEEKHINPKGTTDQEKVWGAIQGLASSYGDPYTVFMPPSDAKIFEGDIAGSFEGVGMEIGVRDQILTVIAPLEGMPADKAGVKTSDKILKIDGKTTEGMNADEAVKLIRGEGGTKVNLTVYRDGENAPREIPVMRGAIDVPTIKTEKRKDGVFVIRLISFTEKSPDLFRGALREFYESGTNKLIVDLRGNPGGYLDAAVYMASFFLPPGKVIVTEDFGKNGTGNSHRSYGYNIFTDQLRLAILIDGGSASASEIFAGALSDHGVAKLVGMKSFGKGSVQELVPVTEDTFLKVTVAQWLTPKGRSITEKGIAPDYEVKYTPEDAAKNIDPQMEKAAEILK